MKKLFLLGLAVAMGFGCAITNYSLITDNDLGTSGATVNTNGKAYIRQSSQIATLFPDGQDNIMWFVDQKANGDRALSNYDFATAIGQPYFKDDSYCSPDWTGCAVVTASDPETGDTSIFDYSLNANCPGLRGLAFLLSTSRYYGECGRAKADRITSMMNIANQMTTVQLNGTTWLKGVLNSTNSTVIMNNNNGSTQAFSPAGDITVYVNAAARRAIVDLSNPVNRQYFQQIQNWATGHPGPYQTITRVYNGESFTSDQQLLVNQLGKFINQHY